VQGNISIGAGGLGPSSYALADVVKQEFAVFRIK